MRSVRDYEVAFYGVLFGIGVLCLWYFTSFVVEGKVIPTSADYLINGFITLITTALGAAFGAYAAFKWNKNEGVQAEKVEKVSALRAALFTLARQINAISFIKQEYLDSVGESEFERAIYLNSFDYPDFMRIKIDIDRLSFFIDENKMNALLDLSLEQDNFELALYVINERNVFHTQVVDPMIEYMNNEKMMTTRVNCEQYLGEKYKLAVRTTNTMYHHVNVTKVSLRKAYESLYLYAKETYPNITFETVLNE